MPEVTSYAHGVPSWIDLSTPDLAASRAFYGPLFGWEFDEQPTDDVGMTYTMVTRNGKAVAGMMLLGPEMAAQGVPPSWSSYVNVDDVDARTARVEPAGGQVIQPPMDVMTAGRMAVIADSTGAVICLWEKREHIGAELVNEHGTLVWNELITPDPAEAAEFYAQVLGWRSETAPMDGFEYTVFHVDGADPNGIAGAMRPPMEGMPAFWGVYFAVDDTDAVVAAAVERGATVLAEPTDLPGVGRMAALLDPQGAAFSVLRGDPSS